MNSSKVLTFQGPKSEVLPEMNAGIESNQLWLVKRKRKAFYAAVACENFREGTETLLQVSVHTRFAKHLKTLTQMIPVYQPMKVL